MVERLVIKILHLNSQAKLPEYRTDGAAGAGVFAAFDCPVIENPPGARPGIALEKKPL
ncbi:hypothetical protein ACCC98_12510 [Rhizobium pisi]|uniref:hypothetical protein n=1 Tax=Rhizobium pisi TaxID=574561 RepID=UPI0039AEB3A8